jgi:sec-independent protein translocase protein TatB
MFNLDPAKLLVIGVVAIILLGPDKLPQVARQVGGAWRTFNEFRHRMETEVRSSIPDLPSTNEIARLARSPSALLNHISTMGSDDEKSPDGAAATAANGSANGTSAASGPGGRTESTGGTTPSAPRTRPMSTPTPPPTPTRPRPPDTVATGDPSLN